MEQDYLDIVKEAWVDRSHAIQGMEVVGSKLNCCRQSLMQWNWDKIKSEEASIKVLTTRLEELQRQETHIQHEEINDLKNQIERLLEKEDLKWQQRAKQSWYQNGDQNTPYFHAWASQRLRNNRIGRIKDESGREWTAMGDVNKAFI